MKHSSVMFLNRWVCFYWHLEEFLGKNSSFNCFVEIVGSVVPIFFLFRSTGLQRNCLNGSKYVFP